MRFPLRARNDAQRRDNELEASVAHTQNRLSVEPSLSFNANDGVCWTVREYAAGGPMDNGSGRCLVFECDDAMRRVRRFPVDWRELSSAALYDLSWNP